MKKDDCQENSNSQSAGKVLRKAPTGIRGLDDITMGGFPAGRPILVCGSAGCGKTMLGMEFLVRGIEKFGENALFVSFEEGIDQLKENMLSVGFDLAGLCEKKQLKISHVSLACEEVIETGAFSLDPLFMRLEAGINEVGAKRVVIDTIDALFSLLPDSTTLRHEISRLFNWIREKGVTCVITGETGDGTLTRHGLEEYVSDCVIVLDHRVSHQVSKRRLRIVKYRGSGHGKDEYPFAIDNHGFTVLPITSIKLDCLAGVERVSSGIKSLDAMFGEQGYHKGSTIMISGKAGTGKSTFAASFAEASCNRGEKALYLAFEESPSQIVRNMSSVGINLQPFRDNGLLDVRALRPTDRGLEEHLIAIVEAVREVKPECVVVDPVTNFIGMGEVDEVKTMLVRVLDHMKSNGITLLLTALTSGRGQVDETDAKVSSLVDTWIAVEQELLDHKYHRAVHVIKSRGMKHSAEVCRFVMTSDGINIQPNLVDGEMS